MTMPTHREVAGLRIPLPLVPRIIAACRGLYPGLTEGLDDDTAVRAVLKHVVSQWLATWEGAAVAASGVTEVERVKQQYSVLREQARDQALQDAHTIEIPPPPPDPAVP